MKYNLALLAKEMKHSILPGAYQYIASGLGYEISFDICNVEEEHLPEMVRELKETRNGFTVTMPYKVRIMDYCDDLDESAQKCGSANTVLVNDGKLTGFNTDGWGLVKCLGLKGIDFKGKKVAMAGAGGVALSIAYNLLINDVEKVSVVNKYPEETDRLVTRMGDKFTAFPLTEEGLCEASKDADIYINASVLGQLGFDDYSTFAFLDQLKKDAVIYDVNYANPDAKLVKEARAKGFVCYIGNTMSALQGVRAMEIWTGDRLDNQKALQMMEMVEGGQLKVC